MGAPAGLQSDNGSEFTSKVITELKEKWPGLTLVHGKPRHQSSVERANGDIKDMLVTWFADNNSQDWSVGIKFVQFQKNAAHHPYSAMFGCEARVGLTFSALPTVVVSRLESEGDLIVVMSGDDTTTIQILHDHRAQFQKHRVEAYKGQVSQAERMVKCSRLDFKVGEPGDNVAVPVPAVDRGRGDPQNILGVIVSRDLDNDQYKIAVNSGILKGQHSRNQFDLCPQRLLTEDDVNAVSLREAVIAQSACGGQGFTRCNCSGLKKCSTNRCK
ncbi:uncharacterized protein LOC119576745 [Penaeus monodon]|uniref:uncharacterized protein LOC119576745 n=1 Tax=Penaeus monodon TaxID=6687 RepID=UPI0018A6FB64|nr:uncharacterized protein LOC119576745 [Penaeus monodon]